jgi:hypothetical protein
MAKVMCIRGVGGGVEEEFTLSGILMEQEKDRLK